MSWIDQRPDDAMDGAFTVVAPAPVASVEAKAFREAMSRLGAAVHIVTTAGPAGKTGFTATAVCSVSDKPAMLLVCLNRRSNRRRCWRKTACFASTRSAPAKRNSPICSPDEAACICTSVYAGEWMTLKTGAPVLASAVVAFDCRTIEIKAVASQMSCSARSKRCGSGRAVRRWSITIAPISRSEGCRSFRTAAGFARNADNFRCDFNPLLIIAQQQTRNLAQLAGCFIGRGSVSSQPLK